MTPYIDTSGNAVEPPHVWADHFRRLFTWHYGPERADAIMSSRDPTTQADIARWNRLGRRSAA
jgi:hypothetical protein